MSGPGFHKPDYFGCITALFLERTLIGWGSEISMRVPQAEQYTRPACSTTAGTVLKLRMHLGHFTSMI
jgi:hypothetical protein